MTATASFDVVVIGAGVVGCAVARDLAGRGVTVALVDARADVGDATSKANTAILHTGFDAAPGTLEATLVSRGYRLLADYARDAGIAVEPTGAVLVAWTDEEHDVLDGLAEKAHRNGVDDVHRVAAAADEIPALGPGAGAGLVVPGESIIDPWSTTVAYATDALARGATLLLGHEVAALEVGGERTTLVTSRGRISTGWVVNAAGLGADVIDAMLGFARFRVTPRRGELIVFDKLARPLAPRIVLPVPTDRGKGVLVSPTIFGNVMLGPTSQDVVDRGDTSTTREGLSSLLDHARRIMPQLIAEEVTATYTGLRAATEHSDYVIDVDVPRRYLLLGGIRSTGLTASLAIAEHAMSLLASAGLSLTPREDLPPTTQVPPLGESLVRPYERSDLIAADREYGELVCFCERVSRGEIRDALRSAIPPSDVDGLRRRTRAWMGRCQGFHCGSEVSRMLREAAR